MQRIDLLATLLLTALPGLAPAAEFHTGRAPGLNVTLRSILDEHGSYSDVWGYTSPAGREYALLGTYDGTAIIDITNRRHPTEVGFVPGPASSWRDIKTFGQYMYVVNEAGGGLQVVSLAQPWRPVVVTPGWAGFTTAHNLYIDESTATAFIAGRDRTGGVMITRLVNPGSPTILGYWDGAYVHDVFARDGIMYSSAIYQGLLYLHDLTNPGNPDLLGIVGPYPGAFTHNAWPTEDGRYVLTTDERAGASVRMWDIADPASPSLTSLWSPPGGRGAIPHNAHVKGKLAYVSWYTAGVRVLDLSDPDQIVERAYFDTFPRSNVGAFSGCWGVFPFYPNSPRLFVASDIGRGLFVLELDEEAVSAGAGAAGTEVPAPEGRVPSTAGGGPAAIRLGAPSPHPLRGGSTQISLDLAWPGTYRAEVIDAAGRRVRRLAHGEDRGGGSELRWDGRDDHGSRVARGVYFVRVEAAGTATARKVIVGP